MNNSHKKQYIPSTKQIRTEKWEDIKDSYAWDPNIDYHLYPEKYKVGKGEQGVLICEPYKSEILPHWRFKTPEIAEKSANAIYDLFQEYVEKKDFIGADMARKYLQMGYTRARRYANHKGGRKYDPLTGEEFLLDKEDMTKKQSANIFYSFWRKAETNPWYTQMKKDWKQKRG